MSPYLTPAEKLTTGKKSPSRLKASKTPCTGQPLMRKEMDGTLRSRQHTQLCPTLCDPMEYSLPGSSAHGILQARILEWVAITFSRVSSQSRD